MWRTVMQGMDFIPTDIEAFGEGVVCMATL